MSIRDTPARLDRLQRSSRFKLVAGIAAVAIVFIIFGVYWVLSRDPASSEAIRQQALERAQAISRPNVFDAGPIGALRRLSDSILIMLGSPGGLLPVAIGFVAAAAGLLIITWLGLLLSFLGLLIVGWGLAWPLMSWGPTALIGQIIFGAIPLTLAFLAGLDLLRLILTPSHPVTAIARNILSEAVRMKISAVFIVMLIVLLAMTPGLLNEDQPLRYRVQSWLQYGIGLSYALLAVLTLFLSAASVAFEQRDRIIWQTMSKPTSPWQYILGKWIGVMSLNALLLTVTATGVYMFTEYLRHQPATGEVAYRVPSDPRMRITEDRRLLDTQVLVARIGVQAEPFKPTETRILRVTDEQVARLMQQDAGVRDTPDLRRRIRAEFIQDWENYLNGIVDNRIREMRERSPEIADTKANRENMREQVIEELEIRYRAIDPDQIETYEFPNLHRARQFGRDLSLIYKVQAGSNNPSDIYNITILINGIPFPQYDADGRPLPAPGVRQVALNSAQVLAIPADAIPEDGLLQVSIGNGTTVHGRNPLTILIPPDGLELLYPAGGYELNFFRIMLVLWIKLGFVAAVAIAASTFLSFPVACLVAFGVLFAAESSGFLAEALRYYTAKDNEGNVNYFKVVIRIISLPVAWGFSTYSELKPTENLVDGRLVGWAALSKASAVLGAWTLSVLAIGWAIFRKRELAVYSGH